MTFSHHFHAMALVHVENATEKCKSVVLGELAQFATAITTNIERTFETARRVGMQQTDAMYDELHRAVDALECQLAQYSNDVPNAMSARAVQLLIAIREHFLMVGRCMEPASEPEEDGSYPMYVRNGKLDQLLALNDPATGPGPAAGSMLVLSQTALGVMCHELTDHLRKLTRDDIRSLLMSVGFSDVPTSAVFVNKGNMRALHNENFIGKGRNADDITFESSAVFRAQARKERRRYHQKFFYYQIAWSRFCRIMETVGRRMATENITTDGLYTSRSDRTLERMARFYTPAPEAPVVGGKRNRTTSAGGAGGAVSKRKRQRKQRPVSASDFILMRMLLDFGNSIVKVFATAATTSASAIGAAGAESMTEACVPARPFLRLLESGDAAASGSVCVICVDRFDGIARALLATSSRDDEAASAALIDSLGRKAWSDVPKAVANACLNVKFLNADMRMTFADASEKLIACRLSSLVKWMEKTRNRFIDEEVDIADNSMFVANYEEIKQTAQQAYKKFFSPRSSNKSL